MSTGNYLTDSPRMRESFLDEFRWFVKAAQAPRKRTFREWAEDEIVVPTGPFRGRRFRADRLPAGGLLLDLFSSGLWNRFAVTGPTQTGKSFHAYVMPVLYHLFEMREPVICGIPHMKMAEEKWAKDLLPVIKKSRYRELLPTSGAGSRGGKFEEVLFKNGVSLKFMSGGGGDENRSASTARVLVVTEVDKLDKVGGTSREADKLSQMEARLSAFTADELRVYLECTCSIPTGKIWVEYTKGSHGRLHLPCPHCGEYVSPEREDLKGWREAETEVEAYEQACFVCPRCAAIWSEEDRGKANREALVVHRGQSIEGGKVIGELPKTRTLGYRWNAAHNLFLRASDLGLGEWKAAQERDEENAEKRQTQFVWAMPFAPKQGDAAQLECNEICNRTANPGRGGLPDNTRFLTLGIDVHKYLLWYVLIAWQEHATGHIADYGAWDVPSKDLAVEIAIRQALSGLLEELDSRYTDKRIDQVWIDSGWQSQCVRGWCDREGSFVSPTIGRGEGQQYELNYHKPKKTGATVAQICEEYHFSDLPDHQKPLVEINADYWKSWLAERLATPLGKPGSISLYQTSPREHLQIGKHFTAEKQKTVWIPDKGEKTLWHTESRNNHLFDAATLACCAGHYAGARLIDDAVISTPAPPPTPEPDHDDIPFLITDRLER
ncbi:Phage terminase large subunit (GpA) [Planctomycetales bacterium 10988]|nr:Phage terminase large subunit (GpA) [Planctomycetales bacterium 10988]